MKTSVLSVVSIIAIISVTSCRNAGSGGDRSAETTSLAPIAADSTSITSNTAAANGLVEADKPIALNDRSRKIIKTADLRCRVTDVFAATTHIERLAAATGGQISASRLENATDNTQRLPYKTDSLQQVESYTTTAHLSLRIPVLMLDTVLSDIAANASFINTRNLMLDDVTMRYLSNKLKNDAMASNDAAQKARLLARKSHEAIYSGEYTDERNDTRIDRQIENMQLNDQVTYATLTLDLYQPQRISRSIIPDIEYLMKPTVGQQAGMALSQGWQLLQAMFIALLQVWPLILVIIGGWLLYRYRRAKKVFVRA
jgi:hypothetical protein